MLTIEHLNCGYGKHEILHDISVTIPDKKITAIVGQSGCGKTTFLNLLLGKYEYRGKDNIFKNFKSYGGRGTRIYNRKDFSW